VVYELGLFTGAAKNNRLKRAVFVRVGNSKVASDLKGLTYIPLDPAAPSHLGAREEVSRFAKRLRDFQSTNESPLFHVTSKRELFRAGSNLIAARKGRITLAAKTPVPIMGPRPYDRTAKPFEYEKQQYELYWDVVERAARGELEFTLIASVDSIIEDLKSCQNDDFRRDVNENLRKLFERATAVGSKARLYWHEGLCPPAFLVADDTALIWWKSGNQDSLWIEHSSIELAEALASSRPGSYKRLEYENVALRISASVGGNAA
jgi:hypothetical protein